MFLPRDVAPRLLAALENMPVVILTGMRQTGKSTFLQKQPGLGDRRYVSLDDFAQLTAARTAPELFVESSIPLTIDEAQRAPELLLAIKREVDRDRRPGRFILSGSANFALLRGASESLAGRAVYLTLYPFTRRELLAAPRAGTARAGRRKRPSKVSGARAAQRFGAACFLRTFFDSGAPPRRASGAPISSSEIVTGGMPSVCLGEAPDASIWFTGYEQTYLERDVRELSQVADLLSFRQLLRLAALRTGQVLNQSELGRDAKLNAVTTGRYLSVIETSFLVSRLPPFLGNRTSRLVKSPKLYFSDSGLASHLAGAREIGPDEPLRGALFETYVAQNLASILESHWPQARLAYWNVQGRYEVDFVIEAGQDCMAMEVKAGTRFAEHDLAGLKHFLQITPRCRAAVLAHNGTDSVRLDDRLWALPLSLVLS